MRSFIAVLVISAIFSCCSATAKEPWFCKGSPCPEFVTQSQEGTYDIRLYERATWAAVNVTGTHQSVEYAITKGTFSLAKYIKGDNVEHAKLSAGKPTIAAIQPQFKFTQMHDTIPIVYYLPDISKARKAPIPGDSSVWVYDTPEDKQLYVYSFGGYAKTSSILSSAAKLATALENDNLKYDEKVFVVALYDGPVWPFTNRHNEIWMAPKWSDDLTAQIEKMQAS